MRKPQTGSKVVAGLAGGALLAAGLQFTAPAAFGDDNVERTITGTLEDTTPFRFTVPADWNGTVFVDLDGSGNPSAVARALIDGGAAYGGTSRNVTGWNIAQALDNQVEALERLGAEIGEPTRAIAMGASQGGFVAAGVAQRHPDAIDGVVAMCGGLSGTVSQWNQKLDTVFVLKQLLDRDGELPVIGVQDVTASTNGWRSLLAAAQGTPEGKARIALASAIGQLPAFAQGAALPDPADLEAYQAGWYGALSGGPLPYIGQAMSSRRNIEIVTGGNPSWNVGIDYVRQLEKASPEAQAAVAALYEQAGLSLADDLALVNGTERIAADPEAVARFAEGLQFNGEISVPVVTLDNLGDQISTIAQQAEYKRLVTEAGNGDLLRQAFVPTAGHCSFTNAERVAAAHLLLHRLDTGSWGDRDTVEALNAHAESLDLGAARFIEYTPDRFNRSPLDQDLEGIPVTAEVTDEAGALMLTVAEFGEGVDLIRSGTAPDRWRFTGELPTITVTDSRNAAQAAGGGWSTSGQSTAFTSDAATLGAEHFGWDPRVLDARPGVTAGARSVTALDGGDGLAVPSTLATATDEGRRGATDLGAGLFLDIPVGTPEGEYTAAVTVSLFPTD